MTDAPASGPRLPGPERLAGGLSAIVIVAVVLAIAVPAAGPPRPASTAPASSAAPATSQPIRQVDAAAIEAARAVNRRLAEGELALAVELDATVLDVSAVQVVLRGMNPQLRLGLDVAARLQSWNRSVDVGDRLAGFYEDLRAMIDATLKASIRNEAAYRAGAVAILARLGELPDLNVALTELLVATAPPTSPTGSPSPGQRPTPSPRASAGITPSPTLPRPTTAPPTSAGGTNELANGGFEGTIDPWQLEIAPGASAIGSLDPLKPAAGATSLRVEITSGSPSRAGISARQGGIDVRSGTRYRLSVRVRAESIREIRLSVGSTSGGTYASRLGVAGTGWTEVVLEFLAIAGDNRAVVAIDLGRDTATTWLDEVVLAPVVP